jgi:hypothetical protein
MGGRACRGPDRSRAPFADELDALRPELVALEAYLGGPPRDLRTCHRDLWADNVRATTTGELRTLGGELRRVEGASAVAARLNVLIDEVRSAQKAHAGAYR